MTKEVKVGDWVIYTDYGVHAREIVKVTPQLLRMEGNWPRQLSKGDARILGYAPDSETALRLKLSLEVADIEYRRIERTAKDEYHNRVSKAKAVLDADFRAIFQWEGLA